jgi:hypothetical protein
MNDKKTAHANSGALLTLKTWLEADSLGYCAKELRSESLDRLLTEAVNEHAALLACKAALADAEWLLRKLAVNWKEAGSMKDSALRSADNAREALAALATAQAGKGTL